MTLQEDIINELGTKPTIDPKEEIRKSLLKKIPIFKNICLRDQRWARLFIGRSFSTTYDGRNASRDRR